MTPQEFFDEMEQHGHKNKWATNATIKLYRIDGAYSAQASCLGYVRCSGEFCTPNAAIKDAYSQLVPAIEI